MNNKVEETPVESSFDIYTPKERNIYNYFDGQKQRTADPITLYRRLKSKWPELSVDIKLARSQSKDADQGHEAMLTKIRYIFSLKTFEEGGLLEEEAVGLLDHFLLYQEGIKKNSRTSQTSSPNMEDSATTSGEGQPTSNTSDSGSTENAPRCGVPSLPQLG